MKIQLIRHATVLLNMGGKRILLDPMLGQKGSMAAVPGVPNQSGNPLVDLPLSALSLTKVDAVLLSHLHRDHFDDAAMQMLAQDVPVFCQPDDREKLEEAHFENVQVVEDSLVWEGIGIYRTGGQHGTGSIGQKMGPVAGFVLEAKDEPGLYVTGDTIWCPDVQDAIIQYHPQIIVCYAGAARFSQGDPITMSKEDVYRVAEAAPAARVLAVHMEAWNHCSLSRRELREFMDGKPLNARLIIPEDGEEFDFDQL